MRSKGSPASSPAPAKPAAGSRCSARAATWARRSPPSRWRARWQARRASCWSISRSTRPAFRSSRPIRARPASAIWCAARPRSAQIITRDRFSRVHVITAGRAANDSAAIFDSQRLSITLEALARSYDYVVIDAGALRECSDRADRAASRRAPCWSPTSSTTRRRPGARRAAGRRLRQCQRAGQPAGGPAVRRQAEHAPRRERIVTGLKKTIIRTGLETLYFSGAHLVMRPFVGGVGAILTLHHVRPPRPDRFQPNRLLEVTPDFLEDVMRYLRRAAARPRQPRRDASPADRRRFRPPLRLHHHRRRLSRHAAMGLSDPQAPRGAVRGLHPDQLSGPARRIVVAGARGGDRPQRAHQPSDRRPGAGLRLRDAGREAPLSTTSSMAGCAAFRPRTSCATSCAISAPAITSTSRHSATNCA